MPKFTLIGEHVDLMGKPTGEKTTVEFTAEYLPDVFEKMQDFLRGCGFYVGDLGTYIDVVSDGDFREKGLKEDEPSI